MGDRVDEIAVALWDDCWEMERKKGISEIAKRMRQYGEEREAAGRERCAKIAESFTLSAWAGEIAARIREGHGVEEKKQV